MSDVEDALVRVLAPHFASTHSLSRPVLLSGMFSSCYETMSQLLAAAAAIKVLSGRVFAFPEFVGVQSMPFKLCLRLGIRPVVTEKGSPARLAKHLFNLGTLGASVARGQIETLLQLRSRGVLFGDLAYDTALRKTYTSDGKPFHTVNARSKHLYYS